MGRNLPFPYTITVTVGLVLLCASGTWSADVSENSCFCLKKVVDGLYNPVEYLAIRRDNSLTTLVVEQRGVVRSFLQGWQETRVFLDIRDRVATSSTVGEERGERESLHCNSLITWMMTCLLSLSCSACQPHTVAW